MKILRKTTIRARLLLFVMLISAPCVAQDRKNDLIVKRDSSKVLCRVLVVNDQTIQYKKANDPDGPLFNILKSDIARIVYGNGETEIFQIPAGTPFLGDPGSVIMYPVAPWRSPGFLDNLSVWTPDELKSAKRFYQNGIKSAKSQAVVFISVGAAASFLGVILLKTNDDYYYSEPKPGAVVIGAGIGLGVIGSLVSYGRARNFQQRRQQVDGELARRRITLNQLRIRPWLNPFARSASVSLALQF
jgi:hypothetical protein